MLGRTGLDFLFSRNCLLYKFLYIVHVHIQISSFGRCVRILLSLTHEPSKIDINFSVLKVQECLWVQQFSFLRHYAAFFLCASPIVNSCCTQVKFACATVEFTVPHYALPFLQRSLRKALFNHLKKKMNFYTFQLNIYRNLVLSVITT